MIITEQDLHDFESPPGVGGHSIKWLRPEAVPFSRFRYMKGLGFQGSKYIKGYGNLSLRYLKGPVIKTNIPCDCIVLTY